MEPRGLCPWLPRDSTPSERSTIQECQRQRDQVCRLPGVVSEIITMIGSSWISFSAFQTSAVCVLPSQCLLHKHSLLLIMIMIIIIMKAIFLNFNLLAFSYWNKFISKEKDMWQVYYTSSFLMFVKINTYLKVFLLLLKSAQVTHFGNPWFIDNRLDLWSHTGWTSILISATY